MDKIDFKALIWGIVVIVLTSFALSIILNALLAATGLEEWQQAHEDLYYIILVALSMLFGGFSTQRSAREGVKWNQPLLLALIPLFFGVYQAVTLVGVPGSDPLALNLLYVLFISVPTYLGGLLAKLKRKPVPSA